MFEIRDFMNDPNTTLKDARTIFEWSYENKLSYQNNNTALYYTYQLIHNISKGMEGLGAGETPPFIDFETFTNRDKIDSFILDVKSQKEAKIEKYGRQQKQHNGKRSRITTPSDGCADSLNWAKSL